MRKQHNCNSVIHINATDKVRTKHVLVRVVFFETWLDKEQTHRQKTHGLLNNVCTKYRKKAIASLNSESKRMSDQIETRLRFCCTLFLVKNWTKTCNIFRELKTDTEQRRVLFIFGTRLGKGRSRGFDPVRLRALLIGATSDRCLMSYVMYSSLIVNELS